MADYPEYFDKVADWIFNEFVNGIRRGVAYEQVLASVKGCRTDAMPIRYAAIIDNACVGTVALVANDLKCRNYTPWLASLFVDPAYRNKKIGERLVEKIKGLAAEKGYGELYLRTEHASGYYKKRGWQFVESCVDEYGVSTEVYKISLV